MRNDYEINKRKRSPSPASLTDSKSPLEIFHKAQRIYPPEVGESNAESIERSRLVEQKIQQLKKQRRRRHEENKKTSKQPKGIKHTTINTEREEKGEVYTNNAHIFEFQESLPESH